MSELSKLPELPNLPELSEPPPLALRRTEVTVPLDLPDGFTTDAQVTTFHGLADNREHLALRLGDPVPDEVPLVRLHSECLTGDVLGSRRCDCGPQLHEALERITTVGGYLLYLRQEGRGIGLYPKLDAYALQDAGLDTYQANVALGHQEDERDYTPAAQMLHALGVTRIALLSNNPEKAEQLERLGIEVITLVATGIYSNPANAAYLAAKAVRASALGQPGARPDEEFARQPVRRAG